MNNQRAKEIASSPIMANVTYNGSQIYIESVNENNDSASIHFLNQREKSQEVPLSSLTEHEYWKK
ncbi:H-type small acid-soluble spore protein [Tepidibacter aestuarii]|uniref:H-type small acid-soluble spore protein n=1 Tax=Tepidibacter aestuarii TaxID=2925782 RepID=UPI0020BDDAC2|nr:H-type small acid-soluble spore protein [Tepidibacter aestuarii]CAH2214929.1 small acid-soluble spore protein [Tepidibacter aestuarii]